MKKVVSIRDREIERTGDEFGSAYIMMTKSYFECIDTLKDIVQTADDPRINDLVLELHAKLGEIQAFYKSQEGDYDV